jgi:hypothetical protein
MRILQKRKVSYRKWDHRFGGVPAVILQGKFLAEFGFKLGSYYLVDYRPKKITISAVSEKINNLLEERN